MSTIDLKKIKFKELSAAVIALNNSECFKDKEKIATVGVSKIALVEVFLAAVENVPDNEKGEWTGPEAAGDYYNKIVIAEDPEVVVEVIEKDDEPGSEIKEIIHQAEEDTLLSNEVSDEYPVNKQTEIDNEKKTKIRKAKNKVKGENKKTRGDIFKQILLDNSSGISKKDMISKMQEMYGNTITAATHIISMYSELLILMNFMEITEDKKMRLK